MHTFKNILAVAVIVTKQGIGKINTIPKIGSTTQDASFGKAVP